MANYTNTEYVDMLIIYGVAGENAEAARRLYAQRFPDRQLPSRQTFINLVHRGRETGVLQPRMGADGGRPHRRGRLNVEEQILEIAENNPTVSTREISRQLHIAQSSVWNTLAANGLHPFHFTQVQGLLPTDCPLRRQFCEWLTQQSNANADFPTIVLATDESCFTRDGSVNFHNLHMWSDDNPHAIRQSHFQQRFSLNLWVGIVNNHLIGPYELPARLNGNSYLHFLQDILPGLLEDIPLNVRANMWFLHDGCPAHFDRGVTHHLNNTFPERWIGRGGFISWPPRSPDLNPVDFFVWGYLKAIVYATEVDTIEDLRHRIRMAADQLRQLLQQNVPAWPRNWIRRANKCLEVDGQHFEQLMKN